MRLALVGTWMSVFCVISASQVSSSLLPFFQIPHSFDRLPSRRGSCAILGKLSSLVPGFFFSKQSLSGEKRTPSFFIPPVHYFAQLPAGPSVDHFPTTKGGLVTYSVLSRSLSLIVRTRRSSPGSESGRQLATCALPATPMPVYPVYFFPIRRPVIHHFGFLSLHFFLAFNESSTF